MELDYDKLMAAYEDGLHNQLRNFTTGHDFLETWVPDEDPTRSLFGIFEAGDVSNLEGELRVVIGPKASPTVNWDWLKKETESFGNLSTRAANGGTVVVFKFERSHDPTTLKLHTHKKQDRALRAKPAQPVLRHPTQQEIKIEELLDTDIHPAFQKNTLALSKRVSHEGALKATYSASYGTGTFHVRTNAKKIIQEARHEGFQGLLRTLVEGLCQTVERLSLQEAAEHGALRLVINLLDTNEKSPVVGILTPENADPSFSVPNKLIRDVYSQDQAKSEAPPPRNFWVDRVTKEWLTSDNSAKLTTIQKTIDDLGPEIGYPVGALRVDELKNETRVIVSVEGEVTQLGSKLLYLESALQTRLKVQFEVLLIERKDKNIPRKQTVQEMTDAKS